MKYDSKIFGLRNRATLRLNEEDYRLAQSEGHGRSEYGFDITQNGSY